MKLRDKLQYYKMLKALYLIDLLDETVVCICLTDSR